MIEFLRKWHPFSFIAAGVASVPADAHENCAANASVEIDTHYKKGQSDARGDHKSAEATLRCDDSIYDLSLSIETPPYTQRASSRDTSVIAATYGREFSLTPTADIEVDAHVGLINGAASDFMHGLVNTLHSLGRMGTSRMSPESIEARPLAGLSLRVDQSLAITDGLGANLTPYAKMRTDKVEMGASATVFLMSGNSSLKPNIPDFPAQINPGSGIYASARVSNVFYDAALNGQNMNHIQKEFAVGLQKDFGRIVAGVEMTFGRSRETYNGNKPINQVALNVGYEF